MLPASPGTPADVTTAPFSACFPPACAFGTFMVALRTARALWLGQGYLFRPLPGVRMGTVSRDTFALSFSGMKTLSSMGFR